MQVTETAIPGLVILEPKVFADSRGFFFESYNQREWARLAGITDVFVQDNHSRSARNVLRGLHYQAPRAQGKLVRAVVGAVFDVAVDLRRSSPTFGRWVGLELSAENRRTAWIPAGFAHGFLVMSEHADVVYKTTDVRVPEDERTIVWDDPDLAIAWPVTAPPVLSEKDRAGTRFRDAELFT